MHTMCDRGTAGGVRLPASHAAAQRLKRVAADQWRVHAAAATPSASGTSIAAMSSRIKVRIDLHLHACMHACSTT
jgi:hypothetical protein